MKARRTSPVAGPSHAVHESGRTPRLLVVTSPPPVKRLPELFLGLAETAELMFAVHPDALPTALREHPRVHTVALPLERPEAQAHAVALFRAAADLVRFLRPELKHAAWPRRRSLRRVLQLAGLERSRQTARDHVDLELQPEVCERLATAFRTVERLLPPPPGLVNTIRSLDVDGVLVVTRCILGGTEPDVLKAAREAGLPSTMLVWSWDNLASKATLHEHPDRLLVWNEIQAGEAATFHGVPRERIDVVGAANFDRFFDEVRGQPRPAPNDGRRTLLYLGSSPKVAPSEAGIFDRWLAAVRASDDPAVREARVLLRPHPAAMRKWASWSTGDELVEVAGPSGKTDPVTLSSLLLQADAAAALNTSAELEAAIAGLPVVTFRAGSEARGQEGSAHFRYLLEREGGFVQDARTLDEHVTRLSQALANGADREAADAFLEGFIRPHGLDQPVVPILVDAVLSETLGTRRAAAGPAEEPGAAPRQDGPRLLVVGTPLLLSRFTDLLLTLLDTGAELVFTAEAYALPAELAAHAGASTTAVSLVRPKGPAKSLDLFRTAGDAARFLGPLADASWPKRRALHRLMLLAGEPWTRALARRLRDLQFPPEVSAQLAESFRELERMVPPDPALEQGLAKLAPDAVLVLTRCALGGAEPDAVKASGRLGIPTVALVCSWDNLTAKATLREHPDLLLVWNEEQVREAAELHGIDRERVLALGAPGFDRFFEQLAALEAEPAQGPEKRIVYLGSSTKVAPDEPAIVDEWLSAIRSSEDGLVRDALVTVRPHPSAARRWHGWTPPDGSVTYVEPGARIEPEALARLLYQADAVVGLNTTAEIEAGIAGRPVLTFRARKARGQVGSAHFRYLLAANGGFVVDAQTLAEHTEALGRALRGEYDPEPARRFVQRFVRPAGLDQPVVPLVADAVLRAAGDGAGVDLARSRPGRTLRSSP